MIALLTDFGLHDPYAGIMKGVILGISPHTPLVDLTHEVERHNIRQGAALLAQAAPYFPPGTVFLAVVDPGVGGTRRPVAVEAGGYRFVGPDNGLLGEAVRALGGGRAVELTEPAFRLPLVSPVFHGRDIFAPAAAWLTLGTPLDALGPPVEDWVFLPPPLYVQDGAGVRGEILHVDHFGNLATSIGPMTWCDTHTVELALPAQDAEIMHWSASGIQVSLPRRPVTLRGLHRTYSEASPGALLALVNSAGYLEVSCNQASAAAITGAQTGDLVELRWE
jgi:S-adenosylmethionine hydrolase